MDKKEFEKLVEEALSEIPVKFKKLIQNVAVIVEDTPPSGPKHSSSLLGVYHGIPFQHRGPYYGNMPPDVVVIFQKPIERICRSRKEIKKKVKEVVFHEIGHYFGLSEEDLRKIEENIFP